MDGRRGSVSRSQWDAGRKQTLGYLRKAATARGHAARVRRLASGRRRVVNVPFVNWFFFLLLHPSFLQARLWIKCFNYWCSDVTRLPGCGSADLLLCSRSHTHTLSLPLYPAPHPARNLRAPLPPSLLPHPWQTDHSPFTTLRGATCSLPGTNE